MIFWFYEKNKCSNISSSLANDGQEHGINIGYHGCHMPAEISQSICLMIFGGVV